MENKINSELKIAFKRGYIKASDVYDDMLRIEHVIWGIINTPNFISEIVTERLNGLNELKGEMSEIINTISSRENQSSDVMLKFEESLVTLINRIDKTKLGNKIGVEDFFLSAYDQELEIIDMLINNGVTRNYIETKIKNKNIVSKSEFQGHDDDEWPAKSKKEKDGGSATPVLDSFCRDITELARQDALDPVIGRDGEIERVAQILARRKKNNPILVGEPGVGKTAIVEGLARMIVLNECPRPLKDKRIAALDLAGMVAGTKYRGQFEERIKALIDELKESPDVILFVDEIHTLIGAGNSAGSLDAANILKPALARGEVQCIGATTIEEYTKSIEKDGALDRRFQKVSVNEPTAAETFQIIKRLQERYEDFHGVTYTPGAIEEIIRLSDRYITNRFFPDKAIDVLDEAGSRSQVSLKIPQNIRDLEVALQQVRDQKMEVIKTQNYEIAGKLRVQELELLKKIEIEKAKLREDSEASRMTIDENIISEVVSMMTGIPVSKVSQNEIKRLLNIDVEIESSVIGQETAIKAVASAIKRNRAGVRRKGKPIGSFMFVGSSGVGKTELAKVLAEKVFGSRDALIKIDMSEYAEKFQATKLIGSPPGYVGYDEGGQLTEKVRNKPYCVVLFDEIEKAHPDIFNVLLQLLDEGHLTDGQGRITNFKNTIVIMTSNVGLKQLENFGSGIGYASNKTDNTHSILTKAINDRFRPEFLNRIDEVVFFNTLSRENLFEIIDLQLVDLANRLKEDMDITITIDQSLKEAVLADGYSEKFGAREIQRAIQKQIEDPISEKLLELGLPKKISFTLNYNKETNETIVTAN